MFKASYSLLQCILFALLSGFFLSLLGTKLWLKYVSSYTTQPIRNDGPARHFEKQGTPTMGGCMIMVAFFLSALGWGDISCPQIQVIFLVVGGYALLGLLDDGYKVFQKNSRGISGYKRFFCQIVLTLSGLFLILPQWPEFLQSSIMLPWGSKIFISFGVVGFLVWSTFVITGTANAVNLTDGLDGLVIGPSILVLGALCGLGLVQGSENLCDIWRLPYITLGHNISILCASMIGSCLGFLWYNVYPARIFMGDTGALPLGAFIGCMAISLKQEILLGIMGGVFVLETLSVIVQIAYFRVTRKRIFLMSPLHHHFEKKGWNETTIVLRFWILSALFTVIGFGVLCT